jgi:hypothetical protein
MGYHKRSARARATCTNQGRNRVQARATALKEKITLALIKQVAANGAVHNS